MAPDEEGEEQGEEGAQIDGTSEAHLTPEQKRIRSTKESEPNCFGASRVDQLVTGL